VGTNKEICGQENIFKISDIRNLPHQATGSLEAALGEKSLHHHKNLQKEYVSKELMQNEVFEPITVNLMEPSSNPFHWNEDDDNDQLQIF
jgi:hypothetical protein